LPSATRPFRHVNDLLAVLGDPFNQPSVQDLPEAARLDEHARRHTVRGSANNGVALRPSRRPMRGEKSRLSTHAAHSTTRRRLGGTMVAGVVDDAAHDFAGKVWDRAAHDEEFLAATSHALLLCVLDGQGLESTWIETAPSAEPPLGSFGERGDPLNFRKRVSKRIAQSNATTAAVASWADAARSAWTIGALNSSSRGCRRASRCRSGPCSA
jgi:hypothetical protein